MKLSQYLKEEDISAAKFARKVGMSGAAISNLMNKQKDTYLSIALRIHKETKGKVKPHDLIEESVWREKKKKA